jgi:hypothetical protein
MKTLAALVCLGLALALVPAPIAAQAPPKAAAQAPAKAATQAADLTGDWNATFTLTAPDRTQSITFTFHFTQKGKVLTGTIGPEPARQWKVEKGLVDGAKVTFEVQQPDGPLRSFTLTHAKGRLTGTQQLERNGQKAQVTVEADRAKAK